MRTATSLEALPRQRLYREVYRRLRKAIFVGEIAPGERVHENRLAHRNHKSFRSQEGNP